MASHLDASIVQDINVPDQLIEGDPDEDDYVLDLEQQVDCNEYSGITYETCFPPRYDVDDYKQKTLHMLHQNSDSKPAREYDFVLDPFQEQSIKCLERGESVLVSAHTSAGKTAIAEYSVAMALRDGQRVIYTSPIKALSNQKYRDLYEECNQDVGLMTGDVTINPSASCLVMTTEILRNMLYRGSEVMREVAWVIFDEIHYMRDKERGVVWEETLILLPSTIKFVFLSATIPNATEFACWIAKLHKQPCNVVYTEMRPVPLQHYVFPAGGDGLHLVLDEQSNFRDENFQKAVSVLGAAAEDKTKRKRKRSQARDVGNDISKVVNMIMNRKYYPCIVFSFSKRECEAYAIKMCKHDFTDNDDKTAIGTIYANAIDSLNEDDKKLQAIQNILPILKRGVGIHHGGLLPIIKEVIEILFQEGFLKVLFATETFAMGLNMPAKTVLFTAVRKFDGSTFRLITSGEYIQMSGRAGRRGKDLRGLVIMMLDEQIEPESAKGMIKGKADALYSSFHLGYNMLLNLMRVEDAEPEYMIKRSFHQFQKNRTRPELQRQLDALIIELNSLLIENEESIAKYHNIKMQLDSHRAAMRKEIFLPNNILRFLNPGRLVRVIDYADGNRLEWGWGVLISFTRTRLRNEAAVSLLLDVFLPCDPSISYSPSMRSPADGFKPCPNSKSPAYYVVTLTLDLLDSISSIRLHLPKEIVKKQDKDKVTNSLHEILRRHSIVPLLDPIDDMDINDENFRKLTHRVEGLEKSLREHPLIVSEDLSQQYALYSHKIEVSSRINSLKCEIKEINNTVIMKSTLKAMKRVLRRLGMVDSSGVIALKGRVACEISTADELVASELIFSGAFNNLSPAKIAALVSTMIYDEKGDPNFKLSDENTDIYNLVREAATRIAEVSKESKVDDFDPDVYIQSFKPHMMDVVYSWCNGAKFSEISKLTTIFEGTIIRGMRRLEEVLRQLTAAAKVIGNIDLEAQFSQAISLIKRDIIFAASLYL